MTAEEIKQQFSMRDITARYGLNPNRSGFISCPFHKEKTASMKIYKDSYYCFGCGATGDIFTFVQQMDSLIFKEAFYSLGGTYQKPSFASKMAVYKAKKAKETREKKERKEADIRKQNLKMIDYLRETIAESEPLSDKWCDAKNELQKQLYIHGELNGIPY